MRACSPRRRTTTTLVFTYRWQPRPTLKTLVFRALDDAVFRRDFALRPRPPLQPGDLSFFPPEAVDPAWTLLKRQQVAAELNTLNSLAGSDINAALADLSRPLERWNARARRARRRRDGVHAGHTAGARPEEPDAASPGGLRWRRVGPDVAPNALAAAERAWVDTLDGRATNRWFYRSAYVDEVYNVGRLGLSSPPVWLPDVVPPRAPAITKVTGGNNVIALRWASNREADLAEYRIYRADRVERGRDLRLMTRIRIEPVAAGPPSGRPSEFMWTDASVVPNQTYVYRITAVDNAGNESSPSSPAHGRAYREVPPDAPAWVLCHARGCRRCSARALDLDPERAIGRRRAASADRRFALENAGSLASRGNDDIRRPYRRSRDTLLLPIAGSGYRGHADRPE